MGREEIKDLIHQQTKEPKCVKQEKTTNSRRKNMGREGAGRRQMQLLDRSCKSESSVDYRRTTL